MGVLLVGAILRIAPLADEDLDADEVFSVQVAELPVREGIREIRQDLVHPPGFYFLLAATLPATDFMGIGVRLLPIVAGLAVIAAVASFGLLFPQWRWPALAAAGTVALCDAQIFYSQQTRSYSCYAFMTFLTVILAVAPESVIRNGTRWAALLLCGIVLTYLHYLGCLYLCLIAGAGVLGHSKRKGQVLAWAVLLCSVAAVLLPWLIPEREVLQAKRGLGANLAWVGSPSLYDLKSLYAGFLGVPNIPGATTVVAVAGFCLVFAGLIAGRGATEEERRALLTLVFVAVLPPLGLFLAAVSPLKLPVFGVRHSLPSQAAWGMLTAIGLWRLAGAFASRRTLALTCGILGLFGVQWWQVSDSMRYPRRIPYSQLARLLDAVPSDTAAFTTWPYGHTRSVNIHRHAPPFVRPAPGDTADLPSSFVLLHRPHVEREAAFVRTLAEQGWVLSTKAYVVNRPGAPFGTQFIAVSRPRS